MNLIYKSKTFFVLLLTGICLCAFGVKGYSQGTMQTIPGQEGFLYRVTRDAPNDSAKNLTLNITPFALDYWAPHKSIGGEVSLSYRIKNKLQLFAGFRMDYATFVTGFDSAGGRPTTNLQNNSTNFSAGATWFFYSEDMDNMERVFSKSQANFFPYTRLNLQGIRVGFSELNTRFDKISGDFKGYNIDSSSHPIVTFSNAGTYTSMLNMTVLSLGYVYENIDELIFEMPNPKGFENLKVKNENTSELYIDALYSPVIDFSNIETFQTVNKQTVENVYNINSNTTKMPFGFRLGYTYSTLRTAGLSYNIEAGLRPGLPGFDNMAYGLVKISLSLSTLL